MNNNPQALADAETYLANFLEHSDPPRDSNRFELTDAANDYHERTGDWDIQAADPQQIEDLLARHAK